MNHSQIAVRYAKAFFQLMLEKQKLDSVISDVHFLYSTIDDIEEFRDLLHNPIIKVSKKKDVIVSLFESKISKETVQFLVLIVEHSREAFLQDILRNYIDMYRHYSGIKKVVIHSATQFSTSHISEITQYVKDIYKTDVEFEEFVDEDLVGGFVLRIDDLQFDASVRQKIKKLRKELLSQAV
ncbi:MAG: ATP synthase F1 subunit delta [Bacteroidales bacterium]